MYVKVGDIDIFYTITGTGPTCPRAQPRGHADL